MSEVKICVDQQQFIEAIKERCHTRDLEGNGAELDRIIIDEFLGKYMGCKELADAARNVECWRA